LKKRELLNCAIVKAVERVGLVGLEEQLTDTRDDGDGEEPRRQRAEEGAQRDRQQAPRHGVAEAREADGVMLPIGQQQDRHRDDDGEQDQELDRVDEPAPEGGAGRARHRAIVGRGLLRGGTVIALAVRDALAALQGRGVPELGVVTHGRADIQHAGLADKGVAADLDRSGMDEIGLRAVAQQDGVLAQDGVVADGDEVGADRDEPALEDDI
jgi:hypothetical protein